MTPPWATSTTTREQWTAYLKRVRPMAGESNPRSVLTESAVIHIRALLKGGWYSIKAIARAYNVSPNTIRNIARGEAWKHV